MFHGLHLPYRQKNVNNEFAYLAMERAMPWLDTFATMAKEPTNRITIAREEAGLSLEELAEKSGLSAGYISRMANGGRNVSLKNLRLLARAMSIEPEDLIAPPPGKTMRVPVVTWVSAGRIKGGDGDVEVLGSISLSDLDPRGDWIALEVEGDSMDRISPPGSRVLVNRKDKRLVPNACYIIGDGDNNYTYKRYRPNPARFEPVSTNPAHETIFPEHEPTIVGRVKKTLLDM